MRERDLRDVLLKLDVEVVHKNHRGWLVASCPFAEFTHERGTDSNPSFNIKINERGVSGFKCHSCKLHGTVSSLATKLGYYRDADLQHIALQAAVLEVPESFPDFEEIEESYDTVQPAPLNPHVHLEMYPRAGESGAAREYLVGRGVHRETAELLELRYDPEGRRILFPVFDYKHDLFGLTGRSIIPDAQRPREVAKVKNYFGLRKDLRLLGEHLIEPGKPLLVVEGLFALAHLIEVGARELCNPVAIMGSDLSLVQRDLLVSHDAPVYLCFDDDTAGTVGLFGPFDTVLQEHEGGGAIDMLREHTPTYLTLYPERTNEVDKLTLDEVSAMLSVDNERQ